MNLGHNQFYTSSYLSCAITTICKWMQDFLIIHIFQKKQLVGNTGETNDRSKAIGVDEFKSVKPSWCLPFKQHIIPRIKTVSTDNICKQYNLIFVMGGNSSLKQMSGKEACKFSKSI